MDVVSIVELLDRRLHAADRCRADAGLSVHDPGDGRQANAGERGHVEHRRTLVDNVSSSSCRSAKRLILADSADRA